MPTVWKAPLSLMTEQTIEVPIGAEFLCAREQGEDIAVWFRCDPEAPKDLRTIVLCGTGHHAPPESEARYLGTASLLRGSLMFHVFLRERSNGP